MEYSLPRDGDLRKIVSKRKNETQSPIPNDALRIVPLRAPTPRPGLHPASTNAAPAHNSRGHYSEYRFFAQARNDARSINHLTRRLFHE